MQPGEQAACDVTSENNPATVYVQPLKRRQQKLWLQRYGAENEIGGNSANRLDKSGAESCYGNSHGGKAKLE